MIEASVLLHHENDVIDRLQAAGKGGSDRLRTAFGDCAGTGSAASPAPARELRTRNRAGTECDGAALKTGGTGLAAVNGSRGTADGAGLRPRKFNCEIDGTLATGQPNAAGEGRYQDECYSQNA